MLKPFNSTANTDTHADTHTRRGRASTPMLDAALAYARRGIPVFPLRPRGKAPITPNGFKDATTDEATIRAWWKRTPRANIGIPTGEASGWDVLDFDPRNGGDASGVIPERPPLPATQAARTGSGGLHCVFQHHPSLTGKQVLYAGVDLKADGGYIVAAPSIHPCGEPYQWLDTHELAPLPEWVAVDRGAQSPQDAPDWRTSYTPPARPAHPVSQEDAHKWVTDALAKATGEGSRNRAGFWLSMQLLDNGIPDPEAALAAYVAACPDKPGDAYTMREALRSLASAARYPRREPARAQHPVSLVTKRAERLAQAPDATPEATPYRAFEFTEMGNRDRLLAAHGEDIRYNDAWGFVAWDGKRWRREGAELLVRGWIDDMIAGIKLTAADLARQSALTDDASDSKALAAEAFELIKWAVKSQTDRMVRAVLNLTTYKVVAPVSEFDNAPLLFNCANGTIDLCTGELHPHNRADMLTQISPIVYDPHAQAPQFAAFFEQIMCGDTAVMEYMQRALGYSITGSVKTQVWHMLLGGGSNGKGTLMELIADIIGDYAGSLEPESITLGTRQRSGGEASPDMASLKGKRLVIIAETKEGARIDAARIKALAGGDTITARHLHREPFTFKPTHKIWIHTNHEPQTRETTNAYWRRVRKVHFDFTATKADEDLPERLRAEASGVLAWLVRGCLAWRREGLTAPQAVTLAVAAMRASQDALRSFLVDNCKRDPKGEARASAAELYTAYKAWANDAGERPMSQTKFGLALRERGFTSSMLHGRGQWHGLYLLDATEVTDDTVASWNDAPLLPSSDEDATPAYDPDTVTYDADATDGRERDGWGDEDADVSPFAPYAPDRGEGEDGGDGGALVGARAMPFDPFEPFEPFEPIGEGNAPPAGRYGIGSDGEARPVMTVERRKGGAQ